MTTKKTKKAAVEDPPFVPTDAAKPAAKPAAKKPATKGHKPTVLRIELLDNWMLLSAEVKSMSEQEALALLEYERANRCRPNVVLRLHGRFNRMRAERERTEFVRPLYLH